MTASFSRAYLRRFGVFIAIGAVIAGGLAGRRGHVPTLVGFWTAGAAFLTLALAVPQWLAPACRVSSGLGAVLGWVNTRIILTLVFYGLVTPLVAEIDGQILGLDIHFRMLTPRELARAMEFPDAGSTAIKQPRQRPAHLS